MIDQPAIEHGSTRAGRWLRRNRLQIAFWIAVIEGLLLVFGEITRWGTLLVAVLIIVGYFASRACASRWPVTRLGSPRSRRHSSR
jgi:hypothetical protein